MGARLRRALRRHRLSCAIGVVGRGIIVGARATTSSRIESSPPVTHAADIGIHRGNDGDSPAPRALIVSRPPAFASFTLRRPIERAVGPARRRRTTASTLSVVARGRVASRKPGRGRAASTCSAASSIRERDKNRAAEEMSTRQHRRPLQHPADAAHRQRCDRRRSSTAKSLERRGVVHPSRLIAAPQCESQTLREAATSASRTRSSTFR